MKTNQQLGRRQGNPSTIARAIEQRIRLKSMEFLQQRQRALEEEARQTWGSITRFPEANVMIATEADIATLTDAERRKIANSVETDLASEIAKEANRWLGRSRIPGGWNFFDSRDIKEILTKILGNFPTIDGLS